MALYPTKDRRFIAFSGWEGSGKSEAVKHTYKNLGFFMVPEIARMCFPINESILSNAMESLSEQTFTGYVLGHHFCLANAVTHAVFDRCILDPLTYQALYYPNRQLQLEAIKDYIEELNEQHKQNSLLDDVVLMRHPTNKEFIENVIFADKGRQYSQSAQQYMDDASRFEDIFEDLFNSIPGIAKNLIRLNAHPDNDDVLREITFIASGAY